MDETLGNCENWWRSLWKAIAFISGGESSHSRSAEPAVRKHSPGPEVKEHEDRLDPSKIN